MVLLLELQLSILSVLVLGTAIALVSKLFPLTHRKMPKDY